MPRLTVVHKEPYDRQGRRNRFGRFIVQRDLDHRVHSHFLYGGRAVQVPAEQESGSNLFDIVRDILDLRNIIRTERFL